MQGLNEYVDDMALPEGKTCADCVHARRCDLFGFTPTLTATSCSWSPSRFRLPKVKDPEERKEVT